MLFNALIFIFIWQVAVEAGRWTKIGDVCVRPRANQFKETMYPWRTPNFVGAMRLVHKRGTIGCKPGSSSNWGCHRRSSFINMYVTDLKNQVIYPSPRLVKIGPGGWYKLPGYTSSSRELVFTDFGYPKYLKYGNKLRIWYGEDLFGYSEGDNHGYTCMDIYLYLLMS